MQSQLGIGVPCNKEEQEVDDAPVILLAKQPVEYRHSTLVIASVPPRLRLYAMDHIPVIDLRSHEQPTF